MIADRVVLAAAPTAAQPSILSGTAASWSGTSASWSGTSARGLCARISGGRGARPVLGPVAWRGYRAWPPREGTFMANKTVVLDRKSVV